MAFITKSQVKQAISLGTLNPRIIDGFFHDIKYRAYDYDYLIQDQLIDIYTVQANFKNDVFTHTDYIRGGVEDDRLDKVSIFQLDKSIVHVCKRKDFRHYSFYNKPLTQDAMMKRRDLFKYGILVFINGMLDMDFRIQPRDDKTFLLFSHKRFEGTVRDTDTITAVMIPESLIAVSRVMSRSDLSGKKINTQVFENTNLEYLKECKGFVAFLVRANSQYRPIFLTGISYNESEKSIVFTDLPSSVDGYYMILVGLEQYDSILSAIGSTEYLNIPKHRMPIPANNLLIMVQDNNGYSYHINTDEITLTERYPNIYEIFNPHHKVFKAIVLYTDKISNEMIDYDNSIDYYLDLINLVERYRNNNVPDILRNYKPITWDYLIKDYAESIGVPTPTPDPWYPFLYKLTKINQIYKLWCIFFQTYIRRTYGFLESWLLDVRTIDLATHVRESTLPEIPMSSINYRPFPEPMYLFKYKNYANQDTTTPYAWFIDGKFVVPKYVVSEKGYQYAYFSTDDLNTDSLIEVERFDNNFWSKKFHIDTILEIDVNWLEKPTLMNTIFLTTDDGQYLDSNQYGIAVQDCKYMDDTWYDIDLENSVFILENGMKLRIAANASDYTNTNIRINCNNRAVVWDYNTVGKPNFNTINFNSGAKVTQAKRNIIPRLRMYDKDGRMYPKHSYYIEPRDNFNVLPQFEVYADTSKGDPFKVQYMGYDERQVLYMERIPENGLLNLEGKLDRPFSLVYHSVFLNGYKLNEKHIKQISPFTIAIQNVKFSHDLYIYEWVHAEEVFHFLEDEESSYLADLLLKEDPEYYQKVLEGLTIIIDDPDIPDMDNTIDMMLALIKREIAMKFINMDDIHTPEEYDIYESLFIDNWRLFLNADDRVRWELPLYRWFYLNHDLNILYNGE